MIVFPYGADARLPDLREVDVLVAANVAGFPAADAARVRAFLDRGGSAVVFGGGNLGPASAASYAAAGLSVGEITGTHAARDVPFRIAEFAGDHPMLAPFADPQHGDLHRLTFSGCTRVAPADGVQVLARFRDGTPLLLERQTGPSRVLWCAASVGREHGEWSRSRLFLPLVHQLVRGAAGLAGAGPVRDLPAAGEAPGVRQRGDGWEVRNLEPQESELERVYARGVRQAARRDPGGGCRRVGDGDGGGADGKELRTGELWPWLWLVLVVFWLAEGLLANRTVGMIESGRRLHSDNSGRRSMSATELRPAFRRRFRAVTRQIWSLHVGRGVARTVLVAAALLAAAAAADYFFELSWPVRAGLLAVGAAVVAVLAARWVVRPALAWNRTRVAAELEGLFPRLGQRLRTATQHGERPAEELARDGVAPGLVAALEEETAEKAKPLPFQAALPVRPALVAGVVASAASPCSPRSPCATPNGGPPCGGWRSRRPRTRPSRRRLGATRWTKAPTSRSAPRMSGRARPAVVLHVREVGEPDWRQETMDAADGGFTARLPNLRTTTEFFVAAGPERTPVQQVVVRHAAEDRRHARRGHVAGLHRRAPRDPRERQLLRGPGEHGHAPVRTRPPAGRRDAGREGSGQAEGRRRAASTWRCRTGTSRPNCRSRPTWSTPSRPATPTACRLVANRHRVRVTADQPPSVWFDTPGESMEVHTLAEVLMRARARDDFGLTKVGIVFQVNNEEERTLVLYDVDRAEPARGAGRADADARAVPADAEGLRRLLRVRRGQPPRRARSGRRRNCGSSTSARSCAPTGWSSPDEPMPGPQRDLIFLDEVIARQRFNLNQTMRLETRSKVRIDLAQVEKVAAFENKLATQTHDLADFLIGLGVDGAAILPQAEEAMLSAVDSLQRGEVRHRHQPGARRPALPDGGPRTRCSRRCSSSRRAVRAQARAFDRLQRQKLRRPNEKAETLPQIAEELAKLADEEDEVARTIAGECPGRHGRQRPTRTPSRCRKAEPTRRVRTQERARAARTRPRNAGRHRRAGHRAREGRRHRQGADRAGQDADRRRRQGRERRRRCAGTGDRPTARKEVDKARETLPRGGEAGGGAGRRGGGPADSPRPATSPTTSPCRRPRPTR